MKLVSAVVCSLFLVGCSSIPIKPEWPGLPDELKQSCSPLLTVAGESVEIVDFMETVVKNYNLYHDCVIKNQAWIKWYKDQKTIYEK